MGISGAGRLLASENPDGNELTGLKAYSSPNARSIWGVFAVNSRTTFGDMLDGSSNVLFFGERASRTEEESGRPGGSEKVQRGAIWAGRVNANDTLPGNVTQSAEWGVMGHISSVEDVAQWSINGWDTPRGVASSFHAGGANVVLGDGSTRFVDENMNLQTLSNLVQILDGAVIGGF